jgi:hypothetical protein
MGNSASQTTSPDKQVFSKELKKVNDMVNGILTEKNIFRNGDYNFLSQDVCNKHYILMESELNRHLKVNLKGVGQALFIIPKENDSKYTSMSINKKEVCQKISHHYMKILYVLCLIKYVYNLESDGDYSILGIIMRNIRIIDGIMEINFCNVAQKDFSKDIKDAYKLDFAKLEGLDFMTKYFLEQNESKAFVKVLKTILSRNSKLQIHKSICSYIESTNAKIEHVKTLEKTYLDRFNEKLTCQKTASEKTNEAVQNGKLNLFMYVEKDNPVFSKDYCSEIHKIVIPIKSPGGQQVFKAYNQMKANYAQNLGNIERLINMMVTKDSKGIYILKDIDRQSLDRIINDVKDTIKTYYIQAILDFHKMLDIGKNVPNINMMK